LIKTIKSGSLSIFNLPLFRATVLCQLGDKVMSRIRRVFALAIHENRVLLLNPQDRLFWTLPSTGVKQGETDQSALRRLLETIIDGDFEVFGKVSSEYQLRENTMGVAYACKISAKVPLFKPNRHVNLYQLTTPDQARKRCIKYGHLEIPLILADSQNSLGPMGRIMWDAFSFEEHMHLLTKKHGPESNLQPVDCVVVGDRNEKLAFDDGAHTHFYPRLDPFSPTGKM